MNEKSPFLAFNPPQASTTAVHVDALFWALTILTIVISLGVGVALVLFAVRYRRGAKVDRSHAPLEHLPLEITWSVIPLVAGLGIFAWGAIIYFSNARVPAGAMEVYVVGKQWMWKVQQPNGRWEQNELHVPIGRPVKITLTSEDVIHDFYVPAFRVKMDAVPGRYTTLWFQPNEAGRFHLYCAEFCGTYHSGMVGSVVVMEPADYERWLRTGNTQSSRAAAGQKAFIQYGCNGCHGLNSSVKAPLLEGIYGRQRALQGGGFVVADDRYLRDSILTPQKEIRAGFKPVMPTFRGRISEADVLQIIEYLKTTDTSNGGANGSSNGYSTGQVGPDDVAARTGVVTGSLERQGIGDTIGSAAPGSPRNEDLMNGAERQTVRGSLESTAIGTTPNSSVPQSQRNPRGNVERMTR